MTPPTNNPRRGTVLVLVLVMVAILSLVGVGQLLVTRGEVAAAAAAQHGHQARAAAMSGIHRALVLLKTQRGNFQALYDDPAVFQAQAVTADGWSFTVYADNPDDPANLRYGLEDEAGKLNLNIATEQMLLRLPNMTPALVACLLDYRDSDEEPRPEGAEQDYYGSLPCPYRIKNGPLATVEELLLVAGFDGKIVFGEDANRNGLLEANEDDGDDSFPPDNRDGQLDRGLRYLATTISYEPDVANDGQPRININTTAPEQLSQLLLGAGFSQETADFIVAARGANVRFTDPSQLLEMTLQVIDPRTRQPVQMSSGVTGENLALVMDRLTTGGVADPRTGQQVLFGRVNLSSAAPEALRALTGLDEDAVATIVSRRRDLDEVTGSTTAWIYTENVVSADVFKQVSPLVTARSFQYRVRSFGYSGRLGRFCVLEAVVDLASGAGRITYLRDLTHLGVPLVPGGVER